MKRQPSEWEKIIANEGTDEELTSKKYKQSMQLNSCKIIANEATDKEFAIIVSHSEGCLFILLIVSFVVQKLLSLIMSHLFLFALISNILAGVS